jgi:hypothetical protein
LTRGSAVPSPRFAGRPSTGRSRPKKQQCTRAHAEFAEAMRAEDGGHTIYDPLRRRGLDTFKQIAAMTEAELLRIQNVGPKRRAILRAVLEKHGHQLHDDEAKPINPE